MGSGGGEGSRTEAVVVGPTHGGFVEFASRLERAVVGPLRFRRANVCFKLS